VGIQLERIAVLAQDLGITLDVSEGAKTFLATAGYDPVFGARPLKRAIQRYLQDPLALLLLDEEVAEGTTVRVEAAEGSGKLDLLVIPPPSLSPAQPIGAAEA
jgi:ATP-dependent Clp protease ATP-binding subunit ClpB